MSELITTDPNSTKTQVHLSDATIDSKPMGMSSKPLVSHFSFIFAQKLLNNWRSCSKENDKLQKFEFLILETQIIDLWSDDLLS